MNLVARCTLAARAREEASEFIALMNDSGVQPCTECRPPFLGRSSKAERVHYVASFVAALLGAEGVTPADIAAAADPGQAVCGYCEGLDSTDCPKCNGLGVAP